MPLIFSLFSIIVDFIVFKRHAMTAMTYYEAFRNPLRGISFFFTKFSSGNYSLVATLFFSFVLFTLNMLFLQVVDAMMSFMYFPEYMVRCSKAVIFATLVMFLHVALWSSSRHAIGLFAFCMKALIVNNSVIIMVYLMISFDFVKIDHEQPVSNPNIPVRLR